MKVKEVLLGGIINNPVFILVLGLCPMLAMTTTLEFAFWLGISTMVVLILSNLTISLLRNIIPDKVRIPCYILISATLVTVVELFLGKFLPAVHSELGGFIKLIAVNCIILARAESFANSNKPHLAALDGVSMGVGFLLALCLLGAVREVLGSGAILGHQFIKIEANGVELNGFLGVFSMAAGGFIVFGLLMAAFNHVNNYFLMRATINNSRLSASASSNTSAGADAVANKKTDEKPQSTVVEEETQNPTVEVAEQNDGEGK